MVLLVCSCVLFFCGGLFALIADTAARGGAGQSADGRGSTVTRGMLPACIGIFGGCLFGIIPVIQLLFGPEATGEFLPRFSLDEWTVGPLSLRLDTLSGLFLLAFFPVAGLSALHGFSGKNADYSGKQWFYFSLLALGLTLFTVAGDAVLFLAGCETAVLALVLLARAGQAVPGEAAATAGATGAAGTANVDSSGGSGGEEKGFPLRLFLDAAHMPVVFIAPLLVLLIYGTEGNIRFDALATHIAISGGKDFFFVFALLGFGSMAGLVPLRCWFAEAHPGLARDGMGQGAAMAAGAFGAGGIYGFLRCLTLLGAGETWWGWLAVGLGVLAGAAAAGLALTHALGRVPGGKEAPSILAYAGAAGSGVVFILLGGGLLGASIGSMDTAAVAFTGALLLALGVSPAKALLFLGINFIRRVQEDPAGAPHGTGSSLFSRLPVAFTAILAGFLSLSLLPPLNGFIGLFLGFAGLAVGGEAALHAGNGAGFVISFCVLWGGLFAALCVVACVALCLARLFCGLFAHRVFGCPSAGAESGGGEPEDRALTSSETGETGQDMAPDAPDPEKEGILSGQSALLLLAAFCVSCCFFAPELAVLCGAALSDFVHGGPSVLAFSPAPFAVPALVPGLDGLDRLAGIGAEARDSFYLLYMASQAVLLLAMLGLMFVLIRRRYLRDRRVEGAFAPAVPPAVDIAATQEDGSLFPAALRRIVPPDDAMTDQGFTPFFRTLARVLRSGRGMGRGPGRGPGQNPGSGE